MLQKVIDRCNEKLTIFPGLCCCGKLLNFATETATTAIAVAYYYNCWVLDLKTSFKYQVVLVRVNLEYLDAHIATGNEEQLGSQLSSIGDDSHSSQIHTVYFVGVFVAIAIATTTATAANNEQTRTQKLNFVRAKQSQLLMGTIACDGTLFVIDYECPRQHHYQIQNTTAAPNLRLSSITSEDQLRASRMSTATIETRHLDARG